MSNTVHLLLKQNIGAKNTPIVKVGDEVKRGQLIGDYEGLGAYLHSSVDGKVIEINDDEIVIEANDVQSEDYVKIQQGSTIQETVKNAGIVGLGGAGFPTHIKLGTDLGGTGYILCNAAECEPILSHNMNQVLANPKKLIRGMQICMEACNAAHGVFALKEIHPKEIQALEKTIDDPRITVKAMPDLYPMGEERAVVRECLGVVLDTDKLPSEVNAVVINSETLGAIVDAVDDLKPLIDKQITVAGYLNTANSLEIFNNVPIGTKVGDLIERAGGIYKYGEYGEIIMGGPFTGLSTTYDSPIKKATGGILVTKPYEKDTRKMGLLVCACGGNEARLREIAGYMNSEVVGVERCKQAVEGKGGVLKCENPGHCPGQAEKMLKLKKAGAETVLISNCTDCTNTVMGVAPKMKMPVYHQTDTILETMGIEKVRYLKDGQKK
ncbi:proline reductase-associated electron transfer protein PrdC [Peptostreptococcus equinus]|uniref:Proline reductase-associated electron transfer protein PrdC n=1 Tax=Peptostreptococcus equinus TaxID=3003601 RepID=A0ABY7JRE3_9FIRM|nr:proline reductase-associated electron transfer protein PrdC [Peptostreptococcus sp. CBA3647]WAW14257.1 proline reductase-associated electron transfer protein PrdC [Peptostreptococcus sp. CBA3647]